MRNLKKLLQDWLGITQINNELGPFFEDEVEETLELALDKMETPSGTIKKGYDESE